MLSPTAAAPWPKAGDRSAPTYELGDLLVSALKLLPARPPPRLSRSRSHGVLALEAGLALTSWLALQLGELPPRVHDLVGGLLLVSSAGVCYLGACHALRQSAHTQTHRLGALLLARSSPRSWPREKRRLFLEVCTWMASVLSLYIATHSGWVAIFAGAAMAGALALISDLLAAYLHLLETRLDPQQLNGIGGMLWLKVALPYACVGYIISDTGRTLHGFVLGEEDQERTEQLQSVDQLVFNYLLITLVGASLIIASELLLLCAPTRRAGIVLQGRIVDARKNWELHSLRSLVEVAGTFGATTMYYSSTNDMLLSLQLGTFCGVLLILSSELLASASRPRFVSPPSPQAAMEMPADHWVKLIPVVVMMLYFVSQVYAAIVRAASVPSSSLALMLCFVTVAAITLTVLALSGRRPSLMELGRVGRRLAAKICVGGITLIAPKVSHGLPGVAFSCGLSAFCIAFSRECWDDIEVNEGDELKEIACAVPEPLQTGEVCSKSKEDDNCLGVTQPWSSHALNFVKERYPRFYKRVSWTFVGIMVVSTLDMCSTFFTVIHQEKLALSLSQYSAINVVISACNFARPIYQRETQLGYVPVQVGTLSGMLVTLGGEQVRSCARALPLNEAEKIEVENTQILPLPVMGLLGLVGAVAFNIIYTHLRSIEVAFVLATMSGVIFALVGDMFVIWKPTRKVGMILQERILYFKANFSSHSRRSWMEVVSLCGGWYLSYGFLWPGDLLVAVQFGTTAGIVACVCGELTMEYVAEAERRLIASVSARLSQDSQKDSTFLNLPYEVQFEVAHFLTAEDLLVARATCHKVNNMLKAESARFWLHASLRRIHRDHSTPERSRAHSISHRMGNRARSLVYEAITLVLPKLVGSRDPVQVLTSSNEFNRALKWVYLNADWIRKQSLPPLAKESEGQDNAVVSLITGDVAFDVFRHMPDKASLGIIVTRNEDFSIERVDVPRGIYDMIQRDPFSFVAAETLSTLEVFSHWHLTLVAFATMTLIFIGQFSSDVLRAYVLPESFTWWGVR
ncbi:hypothetical protein PF008_g21754 [Phytophthora fragariae]|uniref:F-box domain-containing protein n=1 Tax=Phytophthora fragariae TaxID=53985 RepID=A0A6G0QVM1_9STRA|nr:hypothetical protein PF008_g21754 [Phytophthora fragariae]